MPSGWYVSYITKIVSVCKQMIQFSSFTEWNIIMLERKAVNIVQKNIHTVRYKKLGSTKCNLLKLKVPLDIFTIDIFLY